MRIDEFFFSDCSFRQEITRPRERSERLMFILSLSRLADSLSVVPRSADLAAPSEARRIFYGAGGRRVK